MFNSIFVFDLVDMVFVVVSQLVYSIMHSLIAELIFIEFGCFELFWFHLII